MLSSIAKKINIPIQFGGGIRDEETLKLVIDSGASFAILGTTAVENPEFVKIVARQYPKQVILSIDSFNERIAYPQYSIFSGSTYILSVTSRPEAVVNESSMCNKFPATSAKR